MKYWISFEVLNDQDVLGGIGKGFTLECATVLMGSDQDLAALWSSKELSGTYKILNDSEWQVAHWMLLNDTLDIEWHWMTMNNM